MLIAAPPHVIPGPLAEVDIELELELQLGLDGDLDPLARRDAWATTEFSDSCWRFGACVVRPACREIVVGGEPRYLQPRPFDLLAHLIEHRGRVVSADELLDAVWATRPCSPRR
ncbi:transcriptional regulator [Roseateles sp. UC29_93]|uniref:winged helix-turn-helix domain-containing protein n=1 Tax=Roseateles sp. UC29_93 TaxID=3350177 RepID=UPI00366CDD76